MNVNPASADFGKTVPWDSLTEEQRNSGDWILLPDVTGEPPCARHVGEFLGPPRTPTAADLLPPIGKHGFDAIGRARR